MNTQNNLKILSLVLVLLLLVACTSKRYNNRPRAALSTFKKNISPSRDLASRIEIKMAHSAIETNISKSNRADHKIIQNKKNIPVAEFKQQRRMARIFAPYLKTGAPADSVLINIKVETKKAESYGQIGFILGILSLLFFPLSIVGLVFSGLAYMNMKNYELTVSNKGILIAGLIINCVAVVLTLLFIAFYLFLFFLFM